MGSFFTNVQVLVGDAEQEFQKKLIVEKINQWTSEKYINTESEDDADRSIVIGSTNESPWLAIYDEATEEQDLENLDKLAAQLSIAVNNYAVGILVHDSDVLCLRLFKNGQLIDSYNNNPEMLVENLTIAQKKKEMGNPELWAPLIGDTMVSELKKAWKGKVVLAEEILTKTAEITGWNSTYCSGGYNTLDYLGIEKSAILRFNLKHKHNESMSEVTSRKPKFSRGSYGANLEKLFVGSKFRALGSFMNVGGPSRGVDIAVWGPAIYKELVKIDSVNLMIWDVIALKGRKPNQGPIRIEGILKEIQTVTGEKSYLASFDEFNILNGYNSVLELGDSYNPEKDFYSRMNSEFHAEVRGNGLKEGYENIQLTCIPHKNRDEGQWGYQKELKVLPSPRWKPIYCLSEIPNYQATEAMLSPHKLFSYIIFNEDVADKSELIIPIFKRWIEETLIKLGGPISVKYSLQSQFYKDKTYKLIHDKLYMGKRWSDNISSFSQLYDMRVADENSDNGIGIKMENKSDDQKEYPPYMMIWYDIKNKNQFEIDNVKVIMELILDSLAEKNMINQSFIASWRDVPDLHTGYTSYEGACGIRASQTKARCERYLRAVTDAMWLSDKLISYIDLVKLKGIAEVTPINQGVKFHLYPNYTLSDLENVLLPILASSEDRKENIHEGTLE